MSNPNQVTNLSGRTFQKNKLCFMYCGDANCDCSASPFYPGNSKSPEALLQKKPKRKKNRRLR